MKPGLGCNAHFNVVRIRELTIYRLLMPLQRKIRHASYSRSSSENILVMCTLVDGTRGWGEGVPREYVTGETVPGSLQQLADAAIDEQLQADCDNWDDVIRLCQGLQLPRPENDKRGCYGNALRCAVELSVLDAFGKLFEEPVSMVTQHYREASLIRKTRVEVQYSGIITADTPVRERLSAAKIRLYGFSQCKVKIGMPGVDDIQRMERLRFWLGSRIDLRLDVNEGWRSSDVRARVEPLLRFEPSSIEQPVPHAEVLALSELRKALPVRIMLDESLTSEHDADSAIRTKTCDFFNLRLSKCGGFLACLRLAARADRAGLGYQLGCHPGESAILSAAGRHFATSVGNIAYLEGSYDRHILRESLTTEDMTFTYGGRAPAIERGGLGVTVVPQRLEKMANRCRTYEIQ